MQEDLHAPAYSDSKQQLTATIGSEPELPIVAPGKPPIHADALPQTPLGKSPLSNNPFTSNTPFNLPGQPLQNPFLSTQQGSPGALTISPARQGGSVEDPGTPLVNSHAAVSPFHSSLSQYGSSGVNAEPGTPLGQHGGILSPFANESAAYNPPGPGAHGYPGQAPSSHGTLPTQDSGARDTVHGTLSTTSEDVASSSQRSSSVQSDSDHSSTYNRRRHSQSTASPASSPTERKHSADAPAAAGIAVPGYNMNVLDGNPQGASYNAVVSASGIHRTTSGDTQGTSTATENDTLDRIVDRMGSNGNAMQPNSSSDGLLNAGGVTGGALGVHVAGSDAQNGPKIGATGIDGILFETGATGAGAAVIGPLSNSQMGPKGALSSSSLLL
jgi:hypothetical protein